MYSILGELHLLYIGYLPDVGEDCGSHEELFPCLEASQAGTYLVPPHVQDECVNLPAGPGLDGKLLEHKDTTGWWFGHVTLHPGAFDVEVSDRVQVVPALHFEPRPGDLDGSM